MRHVLNNCCPQEASAPCPDLDNEEAALPQSRSALWERMTHGDFAWTSYFMTHIRPIPTSLEPFFILPLIAAPGSIVATDSPKAQQHPLILRAFEVRSSKATGGVMVCKMSYKVLYHVAPVYKIVQGRINS